MRNINHSITILIVLIILFKSCNTKPNDSETKISYIVTTNPGIYLKEIPNLNAKNIEFLPFFSEINILKNDKFKDNNTGWFKTEFKNKIGYIYGEHNTRKNIPLKPIKSFQSTSNLFQVKELVNIKSNELHCGNLHSGFCVLQIINLKSRKVILEKFNYRFEDFIDENNVVISFGGGESCDENLNYLSIDLNSLKISKFLTYNFETPNCESDEKKHKRIHSLCIKERCFTISEGEEHFTIKENLTGRTKTVYSKNHFGYKNWKSPLIVISEKEINFLEYFDK